MLAPSSATSPILPSPSSTATLGGMLCSAWEQSPQSYSPMGSSPCQNPRGGSSWRPPLGLHEARPCQDLQLRRGEPERLSGSKEAANILKECNNDLVDCILKLLLVFIISGSPNDLTCDAIAICLLPLGIDTVNSPHKSLCLSRASIEKIYSFPPFMGFHGNIESLLLRFNVCQVLRRVEQ